MRIEAKFLHLQAIPNLLAPYRYLYCVDLEATCDEVEESEPPRQLAVVPDQIETIEIGLVVLDLESLEIVDEFQRFVRPQINPTLKPGLEARRSDSDIKRQSDSFSAMTGFVLDAHINLRGRLAPESKGWSRLTHGRMPAVEIAADTWRFCAKRTNDCSTLRRTRPQ